MLWLMRELALVVGTTWLLLVGGCCDGNRSTRESVAAVPVEPWEGAGPKHVAIIVIDTLRADHLGLYGYRRSTSPTLDELASRSVVFENSFSTSPATLESMISLFTGVAAMQHPLHLPEGLVTLQSLFRDAGFVTYAAQSNPWLASMPALFERGYDDYWYLSRYWGSNSTREVAEQAIAQIEAHAGTGKRGFFYFHFLDPHDPYASPKSYGFYDGPPIQPPINVYAVSGEGEAKRRFKESGWRGQPTPAKLTDAQLRSIEARYDDEIRFVDENLAAVMDAFERQGMLGDTLVVVTADHGEAFMEHGLLRHGYQLYDEAIHVPLLLSWPKGLPPRRTADLVSGVDVARTLLAACGIEVPEQMKGIDCLAGHRNDEAVPLRTHFARQEQAGFRSRRWKVIHDRLTDELEVYDLEADRPESVRITDPAIAAEQRRVLEEVLSEHALDSGRPESSPRPLQPDVRKQLEALGYIAE